MASYSGATVCWLGLSVLLAGGVALEISENAPLAPIVTAAPIEEVALGPVDSDPAVIASLSPLLVDDIALRPLFAASRRPFEPLIVEAQPAAATVQERDIRLELVGTMLSESSRIALFNHPDQGLLRLRRGQTVEGWTISAVGDEAVELKRGGEVEWLRLRADLLLPAAQRQKTPNQPKKAGNGHKDAAADKAVQPQGPADR
jgi:hypothetical protein